MDLLLDAVKAAKLARMQIELEYQLDERDRLVPYPSSEEQARYIVYHHSAGFLRWYRYDLEQDLVAALEGCPAEWAFEHPERIMPILTGGPPLAPLTVPHFISGYLPRCFDPVEFKDAEPDEGKGFVVRRDHQVVAWAISVRENAHCAEVAVETAPAYQRRGFARQVTAAWANQVISNGKLAFYSFKADNFASQALAASLGVVIYAEVVGLD